MMKVKELFSQASDYLDQEVTISGWIRNHRKQKDFGFIDFVDGTCFPSLQIVYDTSVVDFEGVQKLHIGSSICVRGKFVSSVGKGQNYEVQATEITLLGDCPEDYPMQPKRHSNEFLRSQAYLRPRVNLFRAVSHSERGSDGDSYIFSRSWILICPYSFDYDDGL